MTKFTPPTEFPHECQSISGNKVTLLAVDSNGAYACLWNLETGPTVADIQGPENLRDIPKVTSTWQNVYLAGTDVHVYSNRKAADGFAGPSRVGVLRIDITDGVPACTMEDG